MKLTTYVRTEAEKFAQRAEAIFERYDFKWGSKTAGGPDYLPDKTEILNLVLSLLDRAGEIFSEQPDCHVSTQSTGRIVIIAYRPEDGGDVLYDVSFSLDIT
jgi:hypothetical protein